MGMLFFAVIIVVWNLVSIGWNDHSSGCYNIYESPATSSSTENLLFADIHNVSCFWLNLDIIKAALNILQMILLYFEITFMFHNFRLLDLLRMRQIWKIKYLFNP